MSSAANILNSSEELMREAEALAETRLSEVMEEKRQQKKRMVKLTSMLIFSAIVFIFTTIAWFTMSDEVGGGSLAMNSSDLPFEIAASGTAGVRNEAELGTVAPVYQNGDPITIDGATYYRTNGSNESVKLRYTTGASTIGPGGSGQIDLWVIPKLTETMKVKVGLEVTAYTQVEFPVLDDEGEPVVDEDGEPEKTVKLIKTSDLTAMNTAGSQIAPADLPKYISAADYVQGHIMFFRELGDAWDEDEPGESGESGEGETGGEGTGEGDTGGEPGEGEGSGEEAPPEPGGAKYYYKDPVGGWEFTDENEDALEGVPYKLGLYWMWPNTLGQIALYSPNAGARSGYPLVSDDDTDGQKILSDYLAENKALIFKNSSDLTDAMIGAPADYIDDLSSGYNQADLDIGHYVNYFLIEVTVEDAS